MRPRLLLALLLPVALHATAPATPLVYTGPAEVAPTSDGGLPPVVGVQNIQVFRANRSAPAHADGLADTYVHAPMLAHWKGRFYLEYLSGTVNEHDNPTVTSLTSSSDGLTWDAPRVVFPSVALPDGTVSGFGLWWLRGDGNTTAGRGTYRFDNFTINGTVYGTITPA